MFCCQTCPVPVQMNRSTFVCKKTIIALVVTQCICDMLWCTCQIINDIVLFCFALTRSEYCIRKRQDTESIKSTATTQIKFYSFSCTSKFLNQLAFHYFVWYTLLISLKAWAIQARNTQIFESLLTVHFIISLVFSDLTGFTIWSQIRL